MKSSEFRLEPVYIHLDLMYSLMSRDQKSQLTREMGRLNEVRHLILLDAAVRDEYCKMLVDIIISQKVEPLEKLLLEKKELSQGTLVWIQNPFYFSGAANWERNPAGGYKPLFGRFHTTLTDFEGIKLEGDFNVQHAQTDSAFLTLSGRQSCFMFAAVKHASGNRIELRPIYIGRRLLAKSGPFQVTIDHLHVSPDEIAEFSKLAKVTKRSVKLDMAQNIPERQIKEWVAEIIDEQFVPNDWGGEKSDLYTNQITVKGKRCRGAFLFKGRAKFHPMTIKDLGANGDQIQRLFEEDAEIYILQHCHQVLPVIYNMMNVYASQVNKMRHFSIIDGIDTLRILKAYKKI